MGTFRNKQHWTENYFNALFRQGGRGGNPLFYICSLVNRLTQSVLHQGRV